MEMSALSATNPIVSEVLVDVRSILPQLTVGEAKRLLDVTPLLEHFDIVSLLHDYHGVDLVLADNAYFACDTQTNAFVAEFIA